MRSLSTWDAGWNGYDVLAPNPKAVGHAENWIRKLFLEVAATDFEVGGGNVEGVVIIE